MCFPSGVQRLTTRQEIQYKTHQGFPKRAGVITQCLIYSETVVSGWVYCERAKHVGVINMFKFNGQCSYANCILKIADYSISTPSLKLDQKYMS